jgi:hypothetical protein
MGWDGLLGGNVLKGISCCRERLRIEMVRVGFGDNDV